MGERHLIGLGFGVFIILPSHNDRPPALQVGDEGAGHFVKMVHNGIEYGDMQLICEAYHLMKDVLEMNHDEMAQVSHLTTLLLLFAYVHTSLVIRMIFDRIQAFDDWNKTELDSFLIEITANILKYRDADNTHLLPKIRDSAGQKGTGKWTAISALEYGTPVTLIGKVTDEEVSGFLCCHDDIAKIITSHTGEICTWCPEMKG